MKKYLPYRFKLLYKLLNRWYKDNCDKNLVFSTVKKNSDSLTARLITAQIIRKSHLYQNKVDNIKLGAKKINSIVILPNETFSFWKIIGKPSRKKGFKKGRNIIKGVLSDDIGGGLCQLSGILYHTSLLAGLSITERFNHTIDIYEEDERLSPLGTDATVVYGYKDLRIKNNFDFPIGFSITVKDDSISCEIMAPNPIEEKKLIIERKDFKTKREVILFYESDKNTPIEVSTYNLVN